MNHRSTKPVATPVILVVVVAALGGVTWLALDRLQTTPPRESEAPADTGVYLDPDADITTRVEDLLSRMTRTEKVEQLVSNAPAIERLHLPKYNWWNECLHGVQGPPAGFPTTVFPQAIGLAATWNPALIGQMAQTIADEARALHHHYAAEGRRSLNTGLTLFAPNINILRDPRWGRGQETFGEDPYLTSRLGVAYVRGLQGDHPRYLKTIATPKHFAAHSGPEAERHTFNAEVGERDLLDTYYPAFRAAVIEGGAEAVMCAYNRLNDAPCCGSPALLNDILRERWGFEGYVVADCGAVEDLYATHHAAPDGPAAAALATSSGCDLACFVSRRTEWIDAARQGLLPDADIDRALRRLLTAQFRLGLLDPPTRVPYADTSIDVLCHPDHGALARRLARESIVLLHNDGVLPITPTIGHIAVVGPNANDAERTLLGTYHGHPPYTVTPLAGIIGAAPTTRVTHAPGCGRIEANETLLEEAVAQARAADIVIACLGLSAGDVYDPVMAGDEPALEGEQLLTEVPGFFRGDRTRLTLPEPQLDLLRAIQDTGTPVVVVLLSGSAMAFDGPAVGVSAVLDAWYPGQEGGNAIADVLFGAYNPAGRLPMTFYRSVDDLPPFTDYAMTGRTYRYFDGAALYPFGYGLSYTTFEYGAVIVEPAHAHPGDTIVVRTTIRNTGPRAGDEVVQLYVSDIEASAPLPPYALQGFIRVHLDAGAKRTVEFTVSPRQLSMIDAALNRVVEPGEFTLTVAPHCPGHTTDERPVARSRSATLTLTGDALTLPR